MFPSADFTHSFFAASNDLVLETAETSKTFSLEGFSLLPAVCAALLFESAILASVVFGSKCSQIAFLTKLFLFKN